MVAKDLMNISDTQLPGLRTEHSLIRDLKLSFSSFSDFLFSVFVNNVEEQLGRIWAGNSFELKDLQVL